MRKFQNYMKEVVQELKKVSWPTMGELKGSTMVVCVFSIIMAIYIWGVDFGLTHVLDAVKGLFS
jgi:preprotein translocase subunit SecE